MGGCSRSAPCQRLLKDDGRDVDELERRREKLRQQE